MKNMNRAAFRSFSRDFPDSWRKRKTCRPARERTWWRILAEAATAWMSWLPSMPPKTVGLRSSTTWCRAGPPERREEIATIVDYLAKNFPAAAAKTNVNKATSMDLQTQLELTAKDADAIVKYRTDHGDFKDWDGLTKVPGIDTAKLTAKKDSIAFTDAQYAWGGAFVPL
jgi:competence ComEA-like helix-hairpin-helix protein